MNENPNFPQQTNPTQGGNNKTIFIVVIIVLVVLAGGLLAWYFLQNDEGTVNTNTTNTVTNTTNTTVLNTEKDAPEKGTVWIVDSFFNPSVVTIEVGDTVTWVNKDDIEHQVASDPYPDSTDLPELVSDKLGTDDEYQFTFEETGSWVYHDRLNPINKGVIIVK